LNVKEEKNSRPLSLRERNATCLFPKQKWSMRYRHAKDLHQDCPTIRRQKIECNISRETLSDDEDEIRRLISYVKKIGVYHEI
jgi:hypothetical protein